MRGLYAIVDTVSLAARGLDPMLFTRAVLAAKPAMIQLRAKNATLEQATELLKRMAPVCAAENVPLVANDHPQAALDAGVSIVHLGQADRSECPSSLSRGLSTHTLAQLTQALETKPLYVAYGPVFATRSKAEPDRVVGIDGLREAARVASGVPIVAIGGITMDTAASIAEVASMGAIIGALLDRNYERITYRARELHRALGGLT